MDSLIGKEIGQYVITQWLGEGGMAVVYKAHQPSLNRDVAIKILTGPLARDEEFVLRFRREAVAAGALGHPNILTIYDAGTTHDGLHYIVMEYVPGGTLKEFMERGPLPVDRARHIVAQIADALQAAHQHGIVHRDLKPSNILFTRDGRPLLMDFGVALTAAGTRLTRTGMAVGTPEYMSPEQAQGLAVDGRSDIYSLGIMIYEMLTGEVPFVSDTPLATLYQHVHNAISKSALLDSGVPDWLSTVVQQTLSKRPEDRYQTAREMAEALRRERAPVSAPLPGPAMPAAPSAPRPAVVAPAERRRGRGLLWTVSIVAGIVIVAGATYALFFRTPPKVAPTSTTRATIIAQLTDTPSPTQGDTQTLTATAVAAAVATTEVRETKLAGAVAESTRVAEAATATSVAVTAEAGRSLVQTMTAEAQAGLTAEARATQTAEVQSTQMAATEAARKQATQASAAATEAAAVAATEQARATVTAKAIATPKATATATTVPHAILFHRPEMGQDDIFVRRGLNEINLTQHSARDYAAAWSPDGRSIAFVSDRDGNPDVFVMDADGSNPRNLTRDAGFDSAPAWSPDGRWIAFHSTRSGPYQIWLLRNDGSEVRHLVQSGEHDYSPEWSPDGSRIAFYRTVESNNYEIMVANSDGTQVQRLTFEPGWDYFPKWTPSGDQILFKSRREGGDTDRFYVINLDGLHLDRLDGYIGVLDKQYYPWITNFSQ